MARARRAPRTIHIVGAGISGLTLALALAKFGARVVVLERNSEIGEVGAGLQISPNARLCLDRLGLDQALTRASFEPAGIDIFPDGRTHPLQTLKLGEAARSRYGSPYAVMHRGDLAQVLYGAAKRFANIDIQLGVTDFAAERAERGVVLRYTEANGTERREKSFALIGADGVRSRVRTELLSGPKAKDVGRVAWRALVAPKVLEGLVALDKTTVMMGADFHLVIYPLPYRNAINLVMFTQQDGLPEGTTPPVRPRKNARLMAIMQAVGANWTPWVLATVETDRWHDGSIGLIGDAAHAMVPFQAQGAAMGIEDAAVLAPLLVSAPNAEHALSRYEALRRERVRKVAELSLANGRIFHMRWPAAIARNAVIKAQGPMGHFNRLDWLYGYDPSPERESGGPKRPS